MGGQDSMLAHEQVNTNIVSMITCCSLDKIRIPLQILVLGIPGFVLGGFGGGGSTVYTV